MADKKFTHETGCREAVCIDAGRVYDSCSDKDCLENIQVYFTARDQMVLDHAVSARAKKATVIKTCIDVEELPFNRGYFSCDLTFYFEIEVEVCCGRGAPTTTICGVSVFHKKVILFGSEGSVKVFSSEFRADDCDMQNSPTQNLPRCNVQVAEPIVLSSCFADARDQCNCRHDVECGCGCIPECICQSYGGAFEDPDEGKLLFVSIGIFTIVQLIRNVQMLVPVFDFCLPTKDCSCPPTDSPCDLFRKMCFPVDEFFPPQANPGDKGCGCGC